MKLKKDLFWNYISLIIMAIAGLLINIFIVYFYDSSVLGIFNETYAWYMILSQLAVWGIHMSVLKYVPEQESIIEKKKILKSSLFLTTIVSVLLIILVEGVLFLAGNVAWRGALQIAAIGLLFFSWNKIFLSYLNALLEMTTYAVFQVFRYVLLIILVTAISLKRLQYEMLAWAFPITEGMIFAVLFIYFCKQDRIEGSVNNSYLKELFIFGTKILPSNMVVEVNTKVDVVCLGFLMSDTTRIGVYSFAILFSEGFYQLYLIIRKIVNPKIARENAQGRLEKYIQYFQRKEKKYYIFGTVITYVFVLFAYFSVYKIMLPYEYQAGIIYLMIVCFAIAFNGKEIILGNILAQTGNPLAESKLNMVTVLSNSILNFIFIMLWGTVGAAIATAVSHFIYGLCLKKTVKTRLKMEL